MERVRKYAKTMVLEEAVESSDRMYRRRNPQRFSGENRAEVIKVCLYEYNQEEHMKFVREEGIEQGNLTAIRNLMKNMNWSVVEAMKAIGIPEEKWQEYEKKLNESQE